MVKGFLGAYNATLRKQRVIQYRHSTARGFCLTCRQSPHLQLRAGSLDKASNCARDIGGSSETEDSSTAQKHARKVVIVEGLSDRAAVQRAVRHTVFVLGSSTWIEGKNSEAILADLQQGLHSFQEAVVLLDPDHAGRRGRSALEQSFPGHFWHAFLPVASATSTKATRWHEVGNVGVQHASPQSIRQALNNARRACTKRSFFNRDMLIDLGLVASHVDPMAGKTKVRRDRVCDFLGLGRCDGKQLVKQLNLFNFTLNEVQSALSSEQS